MLTLHRSRPRVWQRAAVGRVELRRRLDIVAMYLPGTTFHRAATILVPEVSVGVGGDSPVKELALKQPVWPMAGCHAPVRDHAAPDVPWAAESVMRAVSVHSLEPTIVSPPPVSALSLDPREVSFRT